MDGSESYSKEASFHCPGASFIKLCLGSLQKVYVYTETLKTDLIWSCVICPSSVWTLRVWDCGDERTPGAQVLVWFGLAWSVSLPVWKCWFNAGSLDVYHSVEAEWNLWKAHSKLWVQKWPQRKHLQHLSSCCTYSSIKKTKSTYSYSTSSVSSTSVEKWIKRPLSTCQILFTLLCYCVLNKPLSVSSVLHCVLLTRSNYHPTCATQDLKQTHPLCWSWEWIRVQRKCDLNKA